MLVVFYIIDSLILRRKVVPSLTIILKTAVLAATPIIVYFIGRNVAFFKKKPIYLSQLIAVMFVIVGYLMFG